MLEIDSREWGFIKTRIDSEDCFLATLDGSTTQSKASLLEAMAQLFELPDNTGWDSLIDWMCDLSWLQMPRYCLAVDNYSELLKDDSKTKEQFIDILKNIILPYWEDDVEKIMSGGTPRSFVVFLINES